MSSEKFDTRALGEICKKRPIVFQKRIGPRKISVHASQANADFNC